MAEEKQFFADGFFDWQLGSTDGKNAYYHYDRERCWGGFAPDDGDASIPFPAWAVTDIQKFAGNPIFEPDKTGWDCGRYGGGVHNGSVIKKDGLMYYVYRGEFYTPDDPRLSDQRASGIDYHCDIGLAKSADGIHFERVAGPFFRDDAHFIYSYEDVCVVEHEGHYYMYLNQWNWARANDPADCGVCMAVSDDLIHWDFKGLVFPKATRIHRNACVLQDVDNRAVKDKSGRFVMYINDGLIAYSEDLIHWESEEMNKLFPGGEGCFALAGHDPGDPDAVILFTGGHHTGHFYAVGEVLFSLSDTKTPIEWVRKPVLTADETLPWEDGKLKDPPHEDISQFHDTIFFTGMTKFEGKLYMYYGGSEYYTCLCIAEMK